MSLYAFYLQKLNDGCDICFLFYLFFGWKMNAGAFTYFRKNKKKENKIK